MKTRYMKLNCPLNGDDDTCDQPMEIAIEPRYRATRDEPGSGPLISDVDGPCRHARDFNNGSMSDTDYDYLLEYATNEEYERCQNTA